MIYAFNHPVEGVRAFIQSRTFDKDRGKKSRDEEKPRRRGKEVLKSSASVKTHIAISPEHLREMKARAACPSARPESNRKARKRSILQYREELSEELSFLEEEWGIHSLEEHTLCHRSPLTEEEEDRMAFLQDRLEQLNSEISQVRRALGVTSSPESSEPTEGSAKETVKPKRKTLSMMYKSTRHHSRKVHISAAQRRSNKVQDGAEVEFVKPKAKVKAKVQSPDPVSPKSKKKRKKSKKPEATNNLTVRVIKKSDAKSKRLAKRFNPSFSK